MKRKVTAFVLSMLMVLLIAVTGASAASAGIQLSIKTPDTLPKSGESFNVTVEISGNTGFSAAQMVLAYDETSIECTKVSAGTVLSGAFFAGNPKADDGAKFAAATTEVLDQNGTVAVYSFTALKDLSDYGLNLKEIKLSDINGTKLDVTVAGTSVGITDDDEADVIDKPDEVKDKTDDSEKSTDTSFTDIQSHWGKTYIEQAVKLGLFKGYTDTIFGPDDPVTRAQFVTVLYRLAGSPDVSTGTSFTDIAGQSTEFKSAIAWAYSKGYVNGKSETSFDPSGYVTRQEAMKILFYYAGGVSGTELLLTSTYDSTFADSSSVASWAKAAMYWGIYHEIISGTGNGTLSPEGTATRAQLAKIMVNYLAVAK